MVNSKSFDFASFVSANEGHLVSGFDYLHTVYKSQELSTDFVLWVTILFRPDFETVDGMIVVAALFNAERYQHKDLGVSEVLARAV